MKTGHACLTMNCCNAQLMTRSGKSDRHVRNLVDMAAPDDEMATSSTPAAQAAPAPAQLMPAAAPSKGFLQW